MYSIPQPQFAKDQDTSQPADTDKDRWEAQPPADDDSSAQDRDKDRWESS